MEIFLSILTYLRKLALVFWLGQMLFFIVIFAPKVFKVLPRDMAGKLQAAIFPGYFWVGVVAGAMILSSLLISWAAKKTLPFAGWLDSTILLGAIVAWVIFLYCAFQLNPEITKIQPEALALPKGSTDVVAVKFQELHKLSVKLNGTVLFILLFLLAVL